MSDKRNNSKRRQLSREDQRAWEFVAASTTPLTPTRLPVTAVLVAKPLSTSATSSTAPQSMRPKVPATASVAIPQLDNRIHATLRRGRLKPESRVDLHGLTAARAHVVLQQFIMECHASGKRLVLVITGKGRPSDQDGLPWRQSGVLHHYLPHWLSAAPLKSKVLEVIPAHRRHGGDGAWYIYLRKRG